MPDQLPPSRPPKDNSITPARIVTWIIVGGIGLVLVITGIIGIVTKG